MKTRVSAYPLITCDPFFSVWSFDDTLTTPTRHWAGSNAGLDGFVTVGNKRYRFMGGNALIDAIAQTDCEITPHTTVYTFKNDELKLTVSFFTPYFFDDLATVTLPATYISYKAESEKDVKVEIILSSSLAANGETVSHKNGRDAFVGAAEQNVLSESGDGVTAKWGYLHVLHDDSFCGKGFVGAFSNKKEDHFTLGFDDVKAITFLGVPCDDYYKVKYGSFDEMLFDTDAKFDTYREKAEKFDEKFAIDASVHGDDYVKAVTLACRQSVGAHKLALCDGKPYFISKECFSNGCGATLDVTYPSIPLYLTYAPELVRGMMRPLLAFAGTPMWHFDYAPHDCGQFPLLNRQVYGLNDDGTYNHEWQMPVEECGNAIICVAAAAFEDGDTAFAEENRDLLEKWASYLAENGYCPANQLCTDDFAGHLGKNCNLSLKAIVALACFGKLYNDEKYTALAKKMASDWVKDTAADEGSGLTFDGIGWSLKYNIIWDKIYSLGLFDESVYEKEIAVYTSKRNVYGTPLDSRKDYTKTDWLAWTTVMGNEDYCRETYASIVRMINETPDRLPFTDWYDTVTGNCVGFRNRTVIGGLAVNLLYDKKH